MSSEIDLSKEHSITTSAVSEIIEVIAVQSLFTSILNYKLSIDNLESTWDIQTKASFIEAIITGMPVLYFHFNVSNPCKWRIIDGTQRIIALKEFVIDNAFTFNSNCIVKSLRGLSFKDLSNRQKRNLMEKPLTMHEHECDAAPLYKDLLYKVLGHKKSPH